MQEEKLIQQCKRGKISAQKEVFKMYSSLLRAVCCRYASNSDDAEDIMQEGYIKIFLQMEKFTWAGPGSFSAWMRRVMINTAINHYKKNKNKSNETEISDHMMILDEEDDDNVISILIDSGFSKDELFGFLQNISESNRIVFNLFVLEEYKHKEIAELLNIDERASRIRLLRARKELQTLILDSYKKQLKHKSLIYG